MPGICLYASNLATIIGLNKYGNIQEIIIDLWQKNYNEDYEIFIKKVDELYNVKIEEKKSDQDMIKEFSKKANIDVTKVLADCMNTNNVSNMQSIRNQIEKKIKSSNLSSETKTEFKDTLTKLTNTNFGTVNENSVLNLYCNKYNKVATKTDKFIRKKLFADDIHTWYIGGKVDGITEDKILIEIKNRMYKLFYKVRDYEMIQIQTYLKLLNLNKAHLIECLKKDNKEINIIEINYDNNYWNNIILERIVKFTRFFNSFMKDDELKFFMLLDKKENISNKLNEIYNV